MVLLCARPGAAGSICSKSPLHGCTACTVACFEDNSSTAIHLTPNNHGCYVVFHSLSSTSSDEHSLRYACLAHHSRTSHSSLFRTEANKSRRRIRGRHSKDIPLQYSVYLVIVGFLLLLTVQSWRAGSVAAAITSLHDSYAISAFGYGYLLGAASLAWYLKEIMADHNLLL